MPKKAFYIDRITNNSWMTQNLLETTCNRYICTILMSVFEQEKHFWRSNKVYFYWRVYFTRYFSLKNYFHSVSEEATQRLCFQWIEKIQISFTQEFSNIVLIVKRSRVSIKVLRVFGQRIKGSLFLGKFVGKVF